MTELLIEKEIVVRRSAADVFDAWLDPTKVVRWISAEATERPTMMTEPREGGSYRIEVANPGGRMIITGVYEEIIPEERLVFSWQCSAFPGEETRVTVQFSPEASGTRVSLRHENFNTQETREVHSMGWDSCLNSIDMLLTS